MGELFGLGTVGFILLLIIVLFLNFLPTIIAVNRKKSNTTSIVLINIFLGWTIIGWIVALVMALSEDPRPSQIIVNNQLSADRNINPVLESPKSDWHQPPPMDVPKPVPPPPPMIESTPVSTHQDKIAQLKQIKELLDAGVLTQAEFDQEKAKILS